MYIVYKAKEITDPWQIAAICASFAKARALATAYRNSGHIARVEPSKKTAVFVNSTGRIVHHE